MNKNNTILVSIAISLVLFYYFQGNVWSQTTPPGQLSNVHARFSKETDCGNCHGTERGKPQAEKCLACHREMAERIKNKRGYHQDKGEDCYVCHAEHQGRDHSLIELDVKDFDHSETGFTLTGKHQQVNRCGQCHSRGRSFSRPTTASYLLKDSSCRQCHRPPHFGYIPKCLFCHSTVNWRVEPW